MKELWIYVGGMATSLVVVVITYLSNYFWFKAPKLKLKAKTISTEKTKIEKGLIIKFGCQIDVFNYSKNDAYGLQVVSIRFDNENVTCFNKDPEVSSSPITDLNPGQIKFSCHRPMANLTHAYHYYISEDDYNFSENVTIECVYHNQLGRKHTKYLKAKFNSGNAFFTF